LCLDVTSQELDRALKVLAPLDGGVQAWGDEAEAVARAAKTADQVCITRYDPDHGAEVST
jgi:hypothetical protein